MGVIESKHKQNTMPNFSISMTLIASFPGPSYIAFCCLQMWGEPGNEAIANRTISDCRDSKSPPAAQSWDLRIFITG